ncbi:helix-turn-helix domain-containing protein [Priestia aryabhattai]|uniref:helix-turn-helix domain-containing protein n=1 Tax=Priestia aryabhattai TaxID=412384 RepID=UPI001ADB580D|nr:helix-turn-helix domain-containing protein [Priestia aryabhattai]QTL47327.1 helix-turn-helix domain-containing protein [Priestia aryabhattai]
MIKRTLTVKETAQYIGVSKDLIYKMVRTKEIPFIRIGRRVLFRKESIDQWLHSQEIASDQNVDGVIF